MHAIDANIHRFTNININAIINAITKIYFELFAIYRGLHISIHYLLQFVYTLAPSDMQDNASLGN